MNQLEALRQYTRIVADSADPALFAQFSVTDATTNPSLVVKAVSQAAANSSLATMMKSLRGQPLAQSVDRLVVHLGCEILSAIPGRVSTEIDARLSFDTAATVARAQNIMQLYQAQGIAAERVLIKVAATWEGITAAQQLEQQGIRTNLTLLFSLPQAIACAQAKVQLISPFVGRIYDWYKKTAGAQWDETANAGANDPGVKSVRRIFAYYKQHGISTEVMGASFRNTGQILELAGCDLLTIGPSLLEELQNAEGTVERKLSPETAAAEPVARLAADEKSFRFLLNEDAMATEKTAEGIRLFAADIVKMEKLVAGKL